MAVKIRLARFGKKKIPIYRIVAIDSKNKRDGQYLENLGTYEALTGKIVSFKEDRIKVWIDNGAIASDTVKRLQKQHAKSK